MWEGGFWDEMDINPDGTLFFNINEANGGGYSELAHCAHLGLTFSGCHGMGGDYNAHAFVSYCGKYHELMTDKDSFPVVLVHRDGVSEKDLQAAKDYYQTEDMVKLYFKAGEEGLELEVGDVGSCPFMPTFLYQAVQ